MRVLMTTDTVGGVWTFTQELARGLLERGCAVYLVSLGGAPSDSQKLWPERLKHEAGACFSYEAWTTPLEWMEENDRAYYLAAGRLIRIAFRWGADLLHSNQFCFGAVPLSIPKIVTAHSDVLSWAESCRGGVLEESAWLRQYRKLVGDGLESADVVSCPTEWMARTVTEYFSVRGELVVIPNGRSVTPPQGGTRLQAVTAGRLWDEAKNIGMLGDFRSPLPIFVAGETRHGTAGSTHILPDNMLLGRLSQEELLSLFRQSAIYICTSRYEPFGLAPLEAALCGCAVICNDIPSLREVWESGALYFRDSQSLRNLLCRLSEDGEELVAAQHRSYARARHFSADTMTERYLRLYRKVVAGAERSANVA
ncbi:MAG: glycosyltransferase family 4 protein [Silvibacterium sp.]|nr:glycosyltransferase family 4 protein [Silvibacterium sp.]